MNEYPFNLTTRDGRQAYRRYLEARFRGMDTDAWILLQTTLLDLLDQAEVHNKQLLRAMTSDQRDFGIMYDALEEIRELRPVAGYGAELRLKAAQEVANHAIDRVATESNTADLLEAALSDLKLDPDEPDDALVIGTLTAGSIRRWQEANGG